MDTEVVLQIANLVLGAFSPALIAILKALISKETTPKWVVFLISFIYSIALAVVTTLVAGYAFTDISTIVTSVGVIFTSTQVSYNMIMNELGWTDKIVTYVRSIGTTN